MLLVAGVAGALVLVLAVGLTIWFVARPSGQRTPFIEAIEALSVAEAVHYKTRLPGGLDADLTVVRGGEATGRLNVGGIEIDLLRINDRLFLKPPAALLAPINPDKHAATMLAGRWMTGVDGLTTVTAGPVGPVRTGSDIATQLRAAIDRTKKFPSQPGKEPLRGEAAWMASTDAGNLYVSVAKPHRVIRLETAGGSGSTPPPVPSLPALPPLPSGPGLPPLPSLPSSPALSSMLSAFGLHARGPGRPAKAPAVPSITLGPLDFAPMTPDDVNTAYLELIAQIGTLDTAIDTSFRFTLQGQAAFSGCGPGACRVTAALNTSYVGRNAAPRRTVDADMVVTMLGDGAPAGGCTAKGSLPVNGTGKLSCVNNSPAWNAYYNRATTTPGTHVHLAHVVATATAVGQAFLEAARRKTLADHEKYMKEQAQRRNTPTRSTKCTPKDPVYGPLNNGRATSAHAVLCKPLTDGTDAGGIALRGLPPNQTRRPDGTIEFDRGHLLAKRLGGAGRVENLVPMYSKVNNGAMKRCENRVAEAVASDEQVDITVTANYDPSQVIPVSIRIVAVGDRSFSLDATIDNVDRAVNIDECNR